jgi:chemotaxis methyl-accepting protein methylase
MPAVERERWRVLIRERCGQAVSESRFYFVERRIAERMRERGLSTFAAYYGLVSSAAEEGEWCVLVDEIVNRESSFFRHAPSFDVLTSVLLPSVMRTRRQRGERGLSLWSAGCSSGQEPYSMAMALLDVVDPGAWDVRILATDLSRAALAKARAARYLESELRTLPERHRRRHLTPTGSEAADYRVRGEVARIVRFQEQNLRYPDAVAASQRHDVIFCQNVLIYFELGDRLAILNELSMQLEPGGFIVLAPGEGIGLKPHGLRPVLVNEVLVYQRAPVHLAHDGMESERRRNGAEN